MEFVFNIYFDLKLSNRSILPTMYFCEDISVSISDTLKIYYEIDRIFSKFHVGTLCINRCRISEFNTILVNRFINLTNLEIRNCSITSLKIGAFDSLIHLQYINLSNNNISNIDESIFADNFNLRTINLSNNKLIIVKKSVFKNLPLLENLDLGFNKIRILDPFFLNNEQLKQLKLQNNLIYEISDTAFDKLINLNSLDLTRNNLGNLNSKVFLKTTKMITLFLSDNLITYISTDAFSSMHDLLVLHLQDNRIKDIENRFLKNFNLTTLNLGNNKIKCLKGNSFAHNKKLKFLKLIVFETFEATLLYHLDHLVCLELLYELDEMANFLADLVVVLLNKSNLTILRVSFKHNYHYDSIERLQVLQHLRVLHMQCLNDDKIIRKIDISRQLRLLTKLNTLTLKNINLLNITWPRDEGFQSGLKLKSLDLTGMKNTIISNTFCDHPYLEYLNLSFSLVNEILENAFVSLTNLTHFYMDHSQLRHVFSTTFRCNVKLKVISFANNKIRRIDDYAFRYLTSLELLDLRGNILRNTMPRAYKDNKIRIFVDQKIASAIEESSKFSIYCQYAVDGSAWWTFNGANFTDTKSEISYKKSEDENVIILTKLEAELSDSGIYGCSVSRMNETFSDTISINIIKPIKIISKSNKRKQKINQNHCLFCVFSGSNITSLFWTKDDNDSHIFLDSVETSKIRQDVYNATLCLRVMNQKSNGTYYCHATNIYKNSQSGSIDLLIMNVPVINLEFAKAVATDAIFLKWTTNDGNDRENLIFTIKYKIVESNDWILLTEPNHTNSYLLINLEKDTEYLLAVFGTNSAGIGHPSLYAEKIRTLKTNPVFVPDIFVTGSTVDSITVKWSNISDHLNDLIHSFQIHVTDGNNTIVEDTQSVEKPNIYLFTNLKPATTYFFKIKVCSKYTKQCGNWSTTINGTTLEGISGPPINLTLLCVYNHATKSSEVTATWLPPNNPNGKVFDYNVILEGVANYRDENGKMITIKDINLIKNIDANTHSNCFNNVPVNTNYSVKVVVVSKTKKYGEEAQASCRIPSTTPDEIQLNTIVWHSDSLHNKAIFHITVPRISERNAEIYCYRIYMIRLRDNQNLDDLPKPVDLNISTYHEAHNLRNSAVYLAEMFSAKNFQQSVDVGDNKVINVSDDECRIGIKMVQKTTSKEFQQRNRLRRRRGLKSYLPYDGDLDINANYTGYLEIIYKNSDGESASSMYSNYFRILKPGQRSEMSVISPKVYAMFFPWFFQVIIAATFILLVFIASLCLIHRYSKKIANSHGVELITFRSSFGNICRSLRGRRKLVSSWPREMRAAIPKENLLTVFLEKHRDADYEFQREFDLLPEKIAGLTTRASDARENLSKNRYPDIKAYDQTRVCLAQNDSVLGSGYINANFVNGYKNRKKFICAQGPLDSTICDFWRMIWEQNVGIIVMLTNLEEYSKSKCAKYWPNNDDNGITYKNFFIDCISEVTFSDYVLREFLIREESESSDSDDNDEEDVRRNERKVYHYHFTYWKDFNAPDHPSSVVKFVRRINDVYDESCGAILVHCSAGVGRTGTFVAIDSLTQELYDENCVSIFATVCELRHQRNLLVQSLKQYIFVYRALLEIVLYGNTEINVNDLKEVYKRLTEMDSKTEKCQMELEFDKILKMEMETKSVSIASDNNNIDKNRNDDILPFNANCVILIPDNGSSSYINGSFIEGYYCRECYVITQDPIENKTEHAFWRMIFDHNVTVIVMLSELGDVYKRCPKYWPDDIVQYGNLTIQFIQSENCPYFTKREFRVTNTLSNESNTTFQFQYNGWPTVDGEVPQVTRGLLDLIDQTMILYDQLKAETTMVVHCHFGTDRSSMFVGLSILIQQLKIEKRVDVFNVVRKLRSQRVHLMDTFPQYEFLYRAINNYADLHRLTYDS